MLITVLQIQNPKVTQLHQAPYQARYEERQRLEVMRKNIERCYITIRSDEEQRYAKKILAMIETKRNPERKFYAIDERLQQNKLCRSFQLCPANKGFGHVLLL